MSSNRAAVMTAIGRIDMIDVDLPTPKPGMLLLKTEYIGLCGSDIHFFESGMRKGKHFQLPFILGHECSATVVSAGAGTSKFSSGDRVILEPQQTCGICEYCKGGKYNLCADVIFPSVPPYDGMLQRYISFPENLCYKLPPEISSIEGALVEPLAVGLQAAKAGNVGLNSTVTILGAGCIGLLVLLACKSMGASEIIVVDLFDNRLALAQKMGATMTVNASDLDTVSEVNKATCDQGTDVVFETAGNSKTAGQTCSLVKRGGTIVMVGNVQGLTPYPFMDLMYKEGEIKTIYRYRNNFKTAIQAIASGRIDVKPLVTDTFLFEQTHEAFQTAIERPDKVLKIMIKMQ